MSRYTYLLLDADETLFDFEQASAAAFRALCGEYGLPYSPERREVYQDISEGLWARLNRGEVTKEFLVVERFRVFLEWLGVSGDPAECNRIYLDHLGRSTALLPHAEEVCRELSRSHRLYIVTNAVASVQRSRLAASPIAPYIQGAFISEEAGAAKPAKAYYEYIFSRLPDLTAENCLTVGDALESDIRGANNAGLPCCWFNPAGKPRPGDLRIDYEIRDLRQLFDIV